MTQYDYLLERLSEDEESIFVQTESGPVELPKSRCTIMQQDPPWRREKPDMIVVRIPDAIANKHGIQ